MFLLCKNVKIMKVKLYYSIFQKQISEKKKEFSWPERIETFMIKF